MLSDDEQSGQRDRQRAEKDCRRVCRVRPPTMQRGPCHVYGVVVLNCLLCGWIETCSCHSLQERFGEHVVLRVPYTMTDTNDAYLLTLQTLAVLGGRLGTRLTDVQCQRRRLIHGVPLPTAHHTYDCTFLTTLHLFLTRGRFHFVRHTEPRKD